MMAEILKINEHIQPINSDFKSRVTHFIIFNRRITKLKNEITFSYQHRKTLKCFRQHKTTVSYFNFKVT